MDKTVAKKLFVRTYGCQMNVYDSDRMADLLRPIGFTTCEQPEDADMVIMNTCHIREKASEKTFSELGRWRKLKEQKAAAGGQMVIAVAGCVAQAEGEEITRRAPFVDMVFGPQAYHRLPEMVAKASRAATINKGAQLLDTEFPVESKFDHLPTQKVDVPHSAFLTVQEGCDKFCAFCVVPYTRGAEYSRPVAAVVEEAKSLVGAGAKEITLLGQNVNAYHGETLDGSTWDLGHLIFELAALDGLARLRYTTSYPTDMTDALYAAHRDCDVLMPYLHLPVQAGSDRMLQAMNRRYDRAQYLSVIDKLRDMRPDIAMSGDFIVGFPGENDRDFEETLSLVRDVTYAQAYSFKYSPRPGTPAAALMMQVPEEVKSERLAQLQALLNQQQRQFNIGCVGETLPVLLDRVGKRDGQMVGRSPFMQAVYVDAEKSVLGQVLDVEITRGADNSLAGQLADQDNSKAA